MTTHFERIRRDREFGRGEFEIGYFDRHENTVHRLASREIMVPPNQHRFVEIQDAIGMVLRPRAGAADSQRGK